MTTSAQQAIIDLVQQFIFDPEGFVRTVYPWGEGELAGQDGPDEWQCEVMREMRTMMIEAAGKPEAEQAALLYAVSSGHGIGKTAFVAWIIHWFISTRSFPQIVVTANTGNQLHTKTWRELAKWHKMSIHADWFEHTATRFFLKDHPKTWFAAAIEQTEHNAQAFAGTHEKNVLMVFDEASTIPDIIWETAEGAMTTPGAMWLAMGNMTENTGRFRACFGRFRHRWKTWQIDSRRAKMANKAQIQKWLEDWGEDSDFFRVRVRGLPPRTGSKQFISSDTILACQQYTAVGYENFPIRVTCDVARYGEDMTVIMVIQGRKILEIRKFREIDTMQCVSFIIETMNSYGSDQCLVDGVGVGAGVVDRLRSMGVNVLDVQSGGRADDPAVYFNKRAEMWGRMRDALKEGFEIPADERELADDLGGIEYSMDNPRQCIQLEPVAKMKKRGLPSPDVATALALNFAYPYQNSVGYTKARKIHKNSAGITTLRRRRTR